jgi:hypothetical protein
MSDRQSCPSKEVLVTALYGEADPGEQAAVQRHIAACEACRAEFDELGVVRQVLREWEAPPLGENFRIVSAPAGPSAPGRVVAGPSRWWAGPAATWAGLAAAAVLVIGVSAGLANLDVTVGPDGVRLRTGWAHTEASAAPPVQPVRGEAAGATTPAPVSVATATPDAVPWRADLDTLEQRLRADMATRSSATSPAGAAAGARADDEALLRRVQALIDLAETRQQQNLALRMTELARDFDMQRKADFVQIQQGLGRAEAEAARAQQMMNYLVRTASTSPR